MSLWLTTDPQSAKHRSTQGKIRNLSFVSPHHFLLVIFLYIFLRWKVHRNAIIERGLRLHTGPRNGNEYIYTYTQVNYLRWEIH